MTVNICMKFHEDNINTFKVTKNDKIELQSLLFSVSKGCNSIKRQSRVMVLAFFMLSDVGLCEV